MVVTDILIAVTLPLIVYGYISKNQTPTFAYEENGFGDEQLVHPNLNARFTIYPRDPDPDPNPYPDEPLMVDNHAALPNGLPPSVNATTRVPILMYHYIGNYYDPSVYSANNSLMKELAVTSEKFEDQMKYLFRSRYRSLTFRDLKPTLKGSKNIIITFDDGYRDFYTNAFPILKRYRLKSTVYIISRFVGRDNYMTWDMLKEVQESGLVTIASHTLNHSLLSILDRPNLHEEIASSKKELEEKLGISIKDFCYPYGNFSQAAVEEVAAAGYLTAVTTAPGKWSKDSEKHLIPRVRINGSLDIEGFKYLISTSI